MVDDARLEGRDRRVERVLEVLNAEPTEELLTSRLKEVSGDTKLARLGPALFAEREEIGSFNDITDLRRVDALTDDSVAALIDGLNRPSFEFETETLEMVQWAHGTELEIERPDAFGPVERRAQGIRIHGRALEGTPDATTGWSWVHMSIQAPTFVEGKQFYVRAVLFNLVGLPQPFGIKGIPLATPYEIEVWDGHVRIAEEFMPYLSEPSNRYVRVPVESSWRLRWGLSVSFSLFVRAVREAYDVTYRVDICSVGVELVTRTGLVVSTSLD